MTAILPVYLKKQLPQTSYEIYTFLTNLEMHRDAIRNAFIHISYVERKINMYRVADRLNQII